MRISAAFFLATFSASSEISAPSTCAYPPSFFRLTAIQPDPVHISRIEISLSFCSCSTSSTSVSVSCLGIRTCSLTKNVSPMNSCRPMICCRGMRAARFFSALSYTDSFSFSHSSAHSSALPLSKRSPCCSCTAIFCAVLPTMFSLAQRKYCALEIPKLCSNRYQASRSASTIPAFFKIFFP